MRGVVGHHLDRDRVELATLDGYPLTTPAETWRHLSTILSIDELIIAGDGLIRRQHPLATRSQLRRAVARHRGQRGATKLRAALAEIRAGTDSARETMLRLLLERSGVLAADVNGVIALTDATSTYGDLVYREHRVVVEYDGRQHATDPRQFARDVIRLEQLAHAGWKVVRVLGAHLDLDSAQVVARVRTALSVAPLASSAP